MSGLCSVLKAPAQSLTLHPRWTLTSAGSVEKLRTPFQQRACSLGTEQGLRRSSGGLAFSPGVWTCKESFLESQFFFLDGTWGESKPRGVQGQALGPPRWLSYSRLSQPRSWEETGSGGEGCVSLKLLFFTHSKSFTESPTPLSLYYVCMCECKGVYMCEYVCLCGMYVRLYGCMMCVCVNVCVSH